jgi:hypothetical protein
VDQGKFLVVATQVRVSIAIGWSAMGSPTGVANADVSVLDRILLELFNQDAKLACSLASLKPKLWVNYRYTCGVIASILKAL